MEPWSPIYAEVLQWGQGENYHPVQDWDLALTVTFSIAETSLRPQARDFFIGCLYTLIGDAVRTNDKSTLDAFGMLVNKPARDPDYLSRWRDRAATLIANPETFDYDYWGHNPSRFSGEDGL